MNSRDGNFEKNISRLVKGAYTSCSPGEEFTAEVTAEALRKLERSKVSSLKRVVRSRWIRAAAAVLIITTGSIAYFVNKNIKTANPFENQKYSAELLTVASLNFALRQGEGTEVLDRQLEIISKGNRGQREELTIDKLLDEFNGS